MEEISPQLQNQIQQFQQVQQQLQAVGTQKVHMETQIREMERTLQELEKAEGNVYKNVGSLLILVKDKEKAKADLEEAMETAGVRVKALERQEKTLREKYGSLQETINKSLPS